MQAVIQFSNRKFNIFSLAIRLLTFSNFSHVDAVLPDGRLLGATFKKGVHVHHTKYSSIKRFKINFDNDIQVEAFYEFLRQQIGKKYDVLSLFGFILRNRKWHEEEKWFCSELIAAAAEYAGVQLVRYQTNRVTPMDILKSIRVSEYDS